MQEKNTRQRYDIVYFVILLRKYGIHIFASTYTGKMLTINKENKMQYKNYRITFQLTVKLRMIMINIAAR